MYKKDENRIAEKIAKTLALTCVRNTFLEDLHAGKAPVSKAGDYSDVKVVDGTGQEIPWTELSRLNDAEMKKLMKEIVNRLYTWFVKSDDPEFKVKMERWVQIAQKWDDPELDKDFLAKIEEEQRFIKL